MPRIINVNKIQDVFQTEGRIFLVSSHIFTIVKTLFDAL